MSPGGVYEIERGPAGKPRYVVVVSREELNRGDYVVIVPFTSAKFEVRKNLPNCAAFHRGEFGFTEDCVAQAEQVRTIPIHALSSDAPLFTLNEDALTKVRRAIGNVIACRCEPISAPG